MTVPPCSNVRSGLRPLRGLQIGDSDRVTSVRSEHSQLLLLLFVLILSNLLLCCISLIGSFDVIKKR